MQKRSAETVEKIVKAGFDEFTSVGYHGTSTKRIAKRAGIAVGSFYNYFEDKKALLMEIYRRHAAKVHSRIAAVLEKTRQNPSALESPAFLKNILCQTAALHEFSPELQRQLTALKYTDPDFQEMLREEDAAAVSFFASVLSSQKEFLRIDDIEAATYIMGQCIEAVIHGFKMFECDIEAERLLSALSDMLYRFLYR